MYQILQIICTRTQSHRITCPGTYIFGELGVLLVEYFFGQRWLSVFTLEVLSGGGIKWGEVVFNDCIVAQ